jgi:L,D-transpeptidase-like protein/putative peptidoglycan binding protein
MKHLILLMIFLTGLNLSASAIKPAKRDKPNKQVFQVEQLLADLGYWIVKVDGVSDTSTRQAIIAFQKVEGLKRTGQISSNLVASLQNASRPQARYTTDGRHIEIDITRQVLLVVDGREVTRVLPISSGNERPYVEKGKRQIAHTPRGVFNIQRQIKGVRRAPLGTLYYPNYFTDGVAIHGSDSVPATPASHGCVRIPRFAEREFSSMIKEGTPVFVYD